MGRALISGGAGFIGSHLCEALVAAGWHVTALDDLSTGRRANIASLLAHPRFTFVEGDVRMPVAWTGDVIFHLASPASPAAYARARVETLTTNAQGTLRMLELARRTGARLVLASTSEVYGDPEEHPQRETYPGRVDPTGPRSCYDEGKRYAEALVAAAVHEWGIDARIARIFNTYGPRMRPDDGRVVVTFVTALLEGRPLRIFGDGLQTRSLCYIDDMVRGLVRLAEVPGLAGEAINLGNPDERTVLQIAEAVQRVAGRTARLVHLPPQPGDPQRRCPDITKARRLLEWSPEVPLEDGLRRTWQWYEAHVAVS
ncbi:MAG: GDP-mannose 4,6-dehydratase [Armatimonadota bacterium]|nr:GDP-mannose 4,6-dehydratase [Armatimonadota bacterium]